MIPALWEGLSSKPRRWVFPLILLILLSRRPDAFLNPQFWAEDATIFFRDATLLGTRSLLQPYDGYYHLYPRVGALLGKLVAVAHAPAFYNLVAALAVLMVAGYCLSARMPWGRGTGALLALAIVAAPVRNEVFLTLTNAQWVLALGLVLLLVSRPPRSPLEWGWDLGVLGGLGLTGPFVAVLLPLYGAKLFRERTRHALALFALAAVCAAIQLAHVQSTLGHARFGGPAAEPIDWTNRDFARVLSFFVSSVFAGRLALPIPEAWGRSAAGFAGFLLLSVGLVACAWRNRRLPAILFLAAGALVLLSTLYAFRAHPLKAGTERYLYIPTVTLVWSFVVLLADLRYAMTGALALCFLSFLDLHRGPPLMDYRWKEASRCIERSAPCVIPVNPPGWFLRLDR